MTPIKSPRASSHSFVRNGAGSAFARSHHPELVFETDERVDATGFVARRSFAYRVGRFPFRIIWALLTLRPLRALRRTGVGLKDVARGGRDLGL